MPRTGSDLKIFLLDAVLIHKYINLFYENGLEEDTFHLYCPRKDTKHYTEANIQIFKDWDARKGHNFSNYTESRQRLLAAMKRSVYLVPVSASKDTYVFRFSTPGEMAVNKQKKKREVGKKKNGPTDKYASDGESHPSSPESLYESPLPGAMSHSSPELLRSASSPGDFASDVEADMLELPTTFYDDLQSFEMTEDPDADLEASVLIPSYTPSDLPGSLDDLCSMYLSENGTEAIPESHGNSSTVEQPKSPQTPEELTQVASSSRTVENKPVLDLQTIQAVLQLIPINFVGLQDASSNPVTFLVQVLPDDLRSTLVNGLLHEEPNTYSLNKLHFYDSPDLGDV